MSERLQLRDWLLALLEHNQTQGLEWLDKQQMIFSISWRHGRKKGWKSETDSRLFKEWAIYKKRYEPGNDKKNAKLWKSRFRCALNALNDVRELKSLSKTKGEDARKIYQFLQTQPAMTSKRRRFPREDKMNFAEFNFDDGECHDKIDTTQTIPHEKEPGHRMEQPSFHSTYTDYQYINSEEWQYIFHQSSQEFLTEFSKFSGDFFSSLNEHDAEANKTIEELLGPKFQL